MHTHTKGPWTVKDRIVQSADGSPVMETENIDRLFLELSQFTAATTAKELRLEQDKAALIEALRDIEVRAQRIREEKAVVRVEAFFIKQIATRVLAQVEGKGTR